MPCFMATGTIKGMGTENSTASSSYTLSKNSLVRYGRVVSVLLELTATSNISAYSTIATIPSGYRPVGQYLFSLMGYDFDITTTGSLRIWNAVTASQSSPKQINIVVTYICG